MWKIVSISLGVGSAQSGADNFASYTKPKNETNLSHSKTLVEIETELINPFWLNLLVNTFLKVPVSKNP